MSSTLNADTADGAILTGERRVLQAKTTQIRQHQKNWRFAARLFLNTWMWMHTSLKPF
jgi:hypothetical protein